MATHAVDEGPKEPFFTRMTPMEIDVQLQVAEMVFRSILEGKRINVCDPDSIDEWHRQTFGDQWVEENNKQRQEIMRQMKEDGENTPHWVEALGHMGDIAWEVFEAGERGERVRRHSDIDRFEILEQFRDLLPKVRESYHARCGAGDRRYGIRACIAIFRVFIRDPEMLNYAATTLQTIVSDNTFNRDGLVEVTQPFPPEERREGFKDSGWSFLRQALGAFVVQAGGELVGEDFGPHPNTEDQVDRVPRQEVAVKIAEVLVAAKLAPTMLAQLALLKDKTMPEGACIERIELKTLLPLAWQKTKELLAAGPDQTLEQLQEMLKAAGADMA
eukprot:gnl/TRDRNA2_/TRDRNA2_186853_c0_seq1.p1 gnl/TRDRNA2_/TRDRNA2_186853_c0~~gnl/TRDRNA2_/TRDRNA2_186853_c0_seq1.p1  ORF type:complete len:330 (-),score=85.09 gnl/TRDRNA2_/TRDRNA2_186853_c0_seq1:156-1145(-)